MTNERLWGSFVIKKGNAKFVKSVRENLNAINSFPLGQKLFARIKKAGITCTIKYRQDWFNTRDYVRHPFGPNTATFFCDPNYVFEKDFEPTIHTVRQKKSTFIYYFHEILHCLHVVQNYFAPTWNAEEEFKTVGLFNYDGSQFTENGFRKLLGLPRRPVYNWIGFIDQKKLKEEMVQRRRHRLPPDPRKYIKNVEDDFQKWEQWKAKNLGRRIKQ